MANEKYLYEIHPTRIIRIPGRTPLRHPVSLMLTKEEVIEYMQYGRVYRKLPGVIEPVLVTGANIDMLHTDNKNEVTEEVEDITSDNTESFEAESEESSKIDESEIVEEDESKNLEEEVSYVDGNEDTTDVDVVEETLPEATEESTDEKVYDPEVAVAEDATVAEDAKEVNRVQVQSKNNSFQMNNNHYNNKNHKK